MIFNSRIKSLSPLPLAIWLLLALIYPRFSCSFITSSQNVARKPIFSTFHSVSVEQPSQLMSTTTSGEKDTFEQRSQLKADLFTLIEEAPNNEASSRELTRMILTKIEELVGASCPTPDEEVLESLAGNWELVWTAQDQSSQEWRNNPIASWINPLENQSYSNNPIIGAAGRSNPFLPSKAQDRLEKMGIVQQAGSTRSSQLVDLRKQRVRNVVSFQLPSLLKKQATLVVDIQFTANLEYARRIDVKFESCLISVPDINFLKNVKIPLGIIGPRGWLTTQYIDDDFRITRGHKGSVFVLTRTKRTEN